MAGILLPPKSQASTTNQRVVHQIDAIVRSTSRFCPNLTLSKAKEGLVVAVVCQERIQTQGIALKAPKTKAKTIYCPHEICGEAGCPPQARFVFCAFVHLQLEETKKGAVLNSLLSRDKQGAPHCCQWSLQFELDTQLTISCVVAVALA